MMPPPAPGGGRVHVIGAGLAGLACAVRLARQGRRVILYEASPQAGGRCRSFFDEELGCTLDNGNHLFLSGNVDALTYLSDIGAGDQVARAERASLAFLDLAGGQHWRVGAEGGGPPFWLFNPSRRVPGESLLAHLKLLRLARATADDTVAGLLDPTSAMMTRLWRPLCRAIMNAEPEEASAQLLWRTLRHSWLRGARYSHPLYAKETLSATFVDPALGLLARHDVPVLTNTRVAAMDFANDRAVALRFGRTVVPVAEQSVVLAVPPAQAAALLPQLSPPLESRPIVNAHVKLPPAPGNRPWALPGGGRFLGLIGGTADWIFLRGELASLTASSAPSLAKADREDLAQRFWADTARVFDLPLTPRPPLRIVKEKRATFAQTPAALKLRPSSATLYRNLFLAGDWLDTGWPATIEGAIGSGHTAADLASQGVATARGGGEPA